MTRPTRPGQLRCGLSLLETLLVLFVLSILAGLIVPAVLRARERANLLQCRNNLKDLALAVHHHHAVNGVMPPYASGRGNEIYGGWYIHLLTYEGYDSVYDLLAHGQRSAHHGLRLATDGRFLPGVHGVRFPSLVCPSDPTRNSESRDSLTNYLANWFAFSDGRRGFYRPAQRFDQLADGLSNIVLFAEGYSMCEELPRLALYSATYHNFGITQSGLPSDDPRLAPDDFTMFQVQPSRCEKLRSQTPHEVMNVALGDVSARFIAPEITQATWKLLLKPRDGEPILGEW